MGRETADQRIAREQAATSTLCSFLMSYRAVVHLKAVGADNESIADDIARVEAVGRLLLTDLLRREPTHEELRRCLALTKL